VPKFEPDAEIGQKGVLCKGLKASFEKLCRLFLHGLSRQFTSDNILNFAVSSYEYGHGQTVNAIFLAGLSIWVA